MHLNLNTLRMFDAAARHLNFRLAAEELHLTQGAVAQQVRKLEADLGVTLFHRKARGLALTDAGQHLHGPLREGLTLIEDALRDLIQPSDLVTISVPPSFAAKWLVPRLSQFEDACPGVRLQVLAEEAKADLRNGSVDLAVRQGGVPQEADLEATLLAPLDLIAVVSDTAAPSITSLDHLGTLPLVQDGHQHWDRLIAKGVIARAPRMLRFNQTALAMDAARNGQGVALIPHLYLAQSGAMDGLRTVGQVQAEGATGFYLLHHSARPLNPSAAQAKDWLIAQCIN